MKPFFRIIVFAGLVMPLLLGACSMPVIMRGGANIFIQDPAPGSVVPLAPVFISAEAFLPSGPVTSLGFFANARSIGEVSILTAGDDPGSFWGTLDWTPPAPGEYFLQVWANSASAISKPVRICVVDLTIPTPADFPPPSGYDGICPIPDRDTSATPGPITLDASAAPDHVLYRPPEYLPDGSWRTTCASPAASLSFNATLNDPPEDVAFVVVYFTLTAGSGGGSHAYLGPGMSSSMGNLPLAPTSPSLANPRTFSSSSDLDTWFEGSLQNDLGGASGEISWTAKAIGRDGAILAENGPHTIPVDVNPLCSPVPLSAPFTLPTPTLASTATPASARDCPSGTFFAEQTHQCLPIQIQPTKKASGCSRYDNASACTSNGCSWDKPSSTCH